MWFILSLLGALLGVLAAVFIIVLIVMAKVRGTLGKSAFKEVMAAMKNARDLEKQEYARQKDVSGMTKLLEEPIQRDFPDFNKSMLFSLIEKNLMKIFTAIENKSTTEIKKDPDLDFMYSKLSDQIEDMKNESIEIKYNNVVFNKHAIQKYDKKNGMATIKTSSSVEYYYSSNIKGEVSHSDVKKQTRYTCEFVYVYDEEKVGYDKEAFGVHCPNCGAPLKRLGAGNCNYCGIHVEPVNLKAWKMISYKEE